ncbi:MAG: 23S rRNA (pseudouridine(1915)-N(3))-methyltransferase RlmH [Oscillospiraceae bacterium]|jgi:23S rRNA (pseudouridine1915-N3)-methyltransferase|nr:23S rRNA (pseudouridine(1915)-N(3))-methyltransferase RlmH [Oscillospiraceae bacterium]
MMRIAVSAAGRLREPYWKAACDEYCKRLGAFCKLSVAEVGDGEVPKVPEGFYPVALCSEGEEFTSEQLADAFRRWQNGVASRVCFLIGGSDGLPERVKRDAGLRLSLSRLTWPHHMVRAMLLEQIYRSFSILSGGKYHK